MSKLQASKRMLGLCSHSLRGPSWNWDYVSSNSQLSKEQLNDGYGFLFADDIYLQHHCSHPSFDMYSERPQNEKSRG